MKNTILFIVLSLFVLIIALSYNWIREYIDLLGVGEPDVKPYKGGKCRNIGIPEGVEACEDIVIHHRTGYAFMACGNSTIRSQIYYPSITLRTGATEQLRETPYIYDINNDIPTPLQLKNFPPEEDFLMHGLGMYEDKNEPNKLYLFFINHRKSGSVIEIFEHIINTKELVHLNTVKHDLIHTPNDIEPISKNEFYITNDHLTKDKIWRFIEDFTRRPWSDVVFYSSITNTAEVVADGLAHPNGVISNWDYSKIYVATSTGGEVIIYDRKSNNKLHKTDRLFTGMIIDNLSVDERTGEIYAAATQKPLVLANYLNDRTGKAPPHPSAIIKISNNTAEDKFYGVKYSLKTIFEDDGSVAPAITIAAVDGQRNVILLGSLREKGIVRCDGLM